VITNILLRGVKKFRKLILVHSHTSVTGIQHHTRLSVDGVINDDIAFVFIHSYILLPDLFSKFCAAKLQKNSRICKIFMKKISNYLHISKKSSTFAADLNKVQFVLFTKYTHNIKYS
jgi:hypothetical protein